MCSHADAARHPPVSVWSRQGSRRSLMDASRPTNTATAGGCRMVQAIHGHLQSHRYARIPRTRCARLIGLPHNRIGTVQEAETGQDGTVTPYARPGRAAAPQARRATPDLRPRARRLPEAPHRRIVLPTARNPLRKSRFVATGTPALLRSLWGPTRDVPALSCNHREVREAPVRLPSRAAAFGAPAPRACSEGSEIGQGSASGSSGHGAAKCRSSRPVGS